MLNQLRTEIGDIDRQLVELIAARQRLAAQVGQAKAAHGIPVKNPGVEASVLSSARERARGLGIDENLVVDVVGKLIEASCRLQQSQRRACEKWRIFVIGAAGGMGQWIARAVTFLGHDVSGYDLRPLPDDIAPAEFEAGVATADFIILATPISLTPQVLGRIAALHPGGVVFDICSVKAPLRDAITAAREAGVAVSSLHPMLGPAAPHAPTPHSPLVVCDTGDRHAADAVEKLFAPSGLRAVRVSLEEHDALMAVVLGLPHLVSLVFAGAIRDFGPSPEAIFSVGGTSFVAQAELAARVSRQCPDLYFEIQAENERTPSVFQRIGASLRSYHEAIETKDRLRFRQLMEQGRAMVSQNGVTVP